jgi:hypothetical protein
MSSDATTLAPAVHQLSRAPALRAMILESTPGPVAPGGTVVGVSKEQRPIICLRPVPPDAPLKVLILAGQHGDERPARRTLRSLLGLSPQEIASRLPNSQLAVIPEVNPDGCAFGCRCNAEGIDLNRDHQLLLSRETAAIHRFVRECRPHVILDLHSYRSRRRHLLERNVVLDHDVFIDVPSHPAILARPRKVDVVEILRRLLAALAARDIHAARYAIVRPTGRVRHSTVDVVDARNGLALRYGAFTLLIENRQPRSDETSADRLRLRNAQERALWTTLEWLDQNAGQFMSSAPLTPASPVPVHFKYSDGGQAYRLAALDADQGQPVNVTFSRYSASLVVRRTVPLPASYAVPQAHDALLGVLRRHGFVSIRCRGNAQWPVERLRIERARPARASGRPARKIRLAPHRMTMELEPYEVFPTQQPGGEALAVFLEPESKHGLHRFTAMGIPLVAPSWYPVLRVFDETGLKSRRTNSPATYELHENTPNHL